MRSYDRIFVDSATTSEYNEVGSEVALVRNRADDKDILQFLSRARQLLISGDYVFVSRMKNLQALAQHGLTIQDAKDVIQCRNMKEILKCLSFHEDEFV